MTGLPPSVTLTLATEAPAGAGSTTDAMAPAGTVAFREKVPVPLPTAQETTHMPRMLSMMVNGVGGEK